MIRTTITTGKELVEALIDNFTIEELSRIRSFNQKVSDSSSAIMNYRSSTGITGRISMKSLPDGSFEACFTKSGKEFVVKEESHKLFGDFLRYLHHSRKLAIENKQVFTESVFENCTRKAAASMVA